MPPPQRGPGLSQRLWLMRRRDVQTALQALGTVLSIDLRSSDVEVCLVTCDDPRFRVLREDEIDRHLAALAERD